MKDVIDDRLFDKITQKEDYLAFTFTKSERPTPPLEEQVPSRMQPRDLQPNPTYTRIRPIYVCCDHRVDPEHLNAVLDGAHELVRLGGVADLVEVKNFNTWRQPDYQSDGQLAPYHSVEWYVADAQAKSDRRSQLNAHAVLVAFQLEPWRTASPHYDIMVVTDDLYDGDTTSFVIGLASAGLGMIVSTHRWRGLDRISQRECLKTATMHELGHVFGLPDRDFRVEHSIGRHCTNTCIMRQGLRVPHDWLTITHDRFERGPLCTDCQQDLQRWFSLRP